MDRIAWDALKEEDLKSNRDLVQAFRKYLKKECGYSAEEAKFAADVIENPFAKQSSVIKTLETTRELYGTMYEVYYCTMKDCAPKPFEFYMLVDVSTLEEKDELWFSYYLAKKKFVI